MAIQTESRRGQWCPYTEKLFCQEGYCEGCQIYLNYLAYLKNKGRLASLLPQWFIEWEKERD